MRQYYELDYRKEGQEKPLSTIVIKAPVINLVTVTKNEKGKDQFHREHVFATFLHGKESVEMMTKICNLLNETEGWDKHSQS